MKCPFELPVKREFTHVNEAGPKYKVVSGKRALAAYLTKTESDYIVQAINSHEKYKALIESELKGMRKMIADNENDPQMRPFAQVLKGRVALYRETLKEEKE